MKRIIFILAFLSTVLAVNAQRILVTDIARISQHIRLGNDTITGIQNDTSLATNSRYKAVSEAAVRAYVGNRVANVATNITTSHQPTFVLIASNGGLQDTVNATTSTDAGVMTPPYKIKVDSLALGAAGDGQVLTFDPGIGKFIPTDPFSTDMGYDMNDTLTANRTVFLGTNSLSFTGPGTFGTKITDDALEVFEISTPEKKKLFTAEDNTYTYIERDATLFNSAPWEDYYKVATSNYNNGVYTPRAFASQPIVTYRYSVKDSTGSNKLAMRWDAMAELKGNQKNGLLRYYNGSNQRIMDINGNDNAINLYAPTSTASSFLSLNASSDAGQNVYTQYNTSASAPVKSYSIGLNNGIGQNGVNNALVFRSRMGAFATPDNGSFLASFDSTISDIRSNQIRLYAYSNYPFFSTPFTGFGTLMDIGQKYFSLFRNGDMFVRSGMMIDSASSILIGYQLSTSDPQNTTKFAQNGALFNPTSSRIFTNGNFEIRIQSNSSTALRVDNSGNIEFPFYSNGDREATLPNQSGRALVLGTTGQVRESSFRIFSSTGSPSGVVNAIPGSLYLNLSGGVGNSLWVKESGIGNTGWRNYISADSTIFQTVWRAPFTRNNANITYVNSRTATMNLGISNTSTNTSANAALQATVTATGGDPFAAFSVTSGATWSTGVDNSSLDRFVIAPAATPSDGLANPAIVASINREVGIGTVAEDGIRMNIAMPPATSQAIRIQGTNATAGSIIEVIPFGNPTGDVDMINAQIGATGLVTAVRAMNTNGGNMRGLFVSSSSDSGGDPYIEFGSSPLTPQTSWSLGLDNNDLNSFKITSNSSGNVNPSTGTTYLGLYPDSTNIRSNSIPVGSINSIVGLSSQIGTRQQLRKITGNTVGQTLVWNGTAWTPSMVSTDTVYISIDITRNVSGDSILIADMLPTGGYGAFRVGRLHNGFSIAEVNYNVGVSGTSGSGGSVTLGLERNGTLLSSSSAVLPAGVTTIHATPNTPISTGELVYVTCSANSLATLPRGLTLELMLVK